MHGLKEWARETMRSLGVRQGAAQPPTVIDNPLEGVSLFRQGELITMACPIEDCVIFNGLSFSSRGFHPFAAAAEELLVHAEQPYEGSILQEYYQRWQPADALDALIGAKNGPEDLRRYPPYLMLAPWLDISTADRLEWIRKTMLWEGKGVTEKPFGPEDGHGLQGPVSRRKGEWEHGRLKKVLESIRARGYDRRHGDLAAQILVRGTEFRFRIVHGHHRAGALKALGALKVVVQPSSIVELETINEWFHVRSGAWSRGEAESYFHHHFDFDSGAWARGLGLGSVSGRRAT